MERSLETLELLGNNRLGGAYIYRTGYLANLLNQNVDICARISEFHGTGRRESEVLR